MRTAIAGSGPAYASPADTTRHGQYRIRREPHDPRPLYRFRDRITADGSSGFVAGAGRYHVYAGRFCPWAHRVTLQVALNGLGGVVTVSYVDAARDARGWAFRESEGPDPVNGFTLLRQAYEATEPGFDGLAREIEDLDPAAACAPPTLTDAAFRGRGLATALLHAVAYGIRARGETPIMHAGANNVTAIRHYQKLGFTLRRTVEFAVLRVPGGAR